MTIHHLSKRDWKHIVDYETFWILSFSAVVLGSGIVALLSISLSNGTSFP
jgi:presenilin-like A22 family membrane protease